MAADAPKRQGNRGVAVKRRGRPDARRSEGAPKGRTSGQPVSPTGEPAASDPVTEEIPESFPASDSPGWTGSTVWAGDPHPPTVSAEVRKADADETRDGFEDIELSVPLDTVCFLVAKAQDLMGGAAGASYEDVVTEDDDPEAPGAGHRSVDPVEIEMHSVISDLNDDAQIDLVALMWLGRDEGDWAELRALAAQEYVATTADYLCGTPLLADYLLAGLDRLGLNCERWFAENM